MHCIGGREVIKKLSTQSLHNVLVQYSHAKIDPIFTCCLLQASMYSHAKVNACNDKCIIRTSTTSL